MFLSGSRLRRTLLAYVFTHADGSFYVRELAFLIHEDPGNLSRELKRLEAEGVVRSSMKGRVKLFSVNKAYPLYKELKGIVFKTEGIAGVLKELVMKYPGIEIAFLHGSFVKDREKADSDVDLVIVGAVPVDKVTRDLRALENKLGREVDLTSYTRAEFDAARLKKGSFLDLVLRDEVVFLKGEL